MKHILNFFKGSLFAVVVLAIAYNPLATEAETPENIEVRGVVTVGAIVAEPAPIFDSIAFIAQKPSTPSATIETPTPTLAPTYAIVASPTAKILAAKVVIPSPTGVEVAVAAPTYAPQIAVSSGVPFDEHFTKYAAAFNVSRDLLVRIARCESGFREGAVNGPYLGMFQYLESTWQSTRNAMGENPDPALRANAEEAIKTSAWKIAHGGIGAWPVCGR